MEAIKNALSPGHAKDNEVMYGTGSETTDLKDQGKGAYNAGVPQGESAPTLHTLPEAEKKEHGILKQILNPGGDKYDASQYGGTATTSAPAEQARRESAPAEKEHGVLRQIINPGGDKYDAQQYGTAGPTSSTSQATTAMQPHAGPEASGGVLAQDASQQQTSTSSNLTQQSTAAPGIAITSPVATQLHSGADSGLSHHVHNGVTEIPQRSGNHTVASASTLRGAGNTESAPVSHISLSGPFGAEAASAHGVYNTVVGKGSGHEPELSTRHNDTATAAGSTAQEPTGTATILPTSSSAQHSSSHVAPTVGASAAAIAAQQAAQRHNTQAAGFGSNDTSSPSTVRELAREEVSSPSQTASSSAGPHSSSLLNKLDPRVKSDKSEHAGRDAAIAGGVGSAALVSHHEDKQNTASSSGTTAPHSSSLLNKLDPRVKTDATGSKQDSHHGKDAAVAGGLGSAGIATHEGEKHQTAPTTTTTSTTTSTTGPHNSDLLNKLDPRVDSDAAKTEKEHHHGRDAAIVGGTAAAGTGLYQATKHDDARAAQPSSTTQTAGPGTGKDTLMSNLGMASNAPAQPATHTGRDATIGSGSAFEPEKDVTGTTSAKSEKPGLLSKLGLKSDPEDKAAKLQKQQAHETHTGRDAAVVGAAGTGIYEAEKHHQSPATAGTAVGSSEKPGLLEKLGLKHDKTDKDATTDPQTHHTRDAALVGGTAVAGAGAYEAGKHHHEKTEPVATSSSETKHNDKENKPGLLTKLGLKHDKSEDAEKDTHKGRDAALVGGTGAVAGAGVYEADKHHKDRSQPAAAQTSSSSHHHEHHKHEEHEKKPGLLTKLGLKRDKSDEASADEPHHGRDAAVAGGTGAAVGAGAYEVGKHHDHSSQSGAFGAAPSDQTYTGPASKTIGPHESNVANVLDPRVQPQPELMKSQQTPATAAAAGTTYTGPASNTIGPHSSDIANVVDPRVQPDPAVQTKDKSDTTTSTIGGGTASAVAHETNEPHSTIEKRHGVAVSEDEKHRNKLHKEPKEPGFISKLIHGKSDKHHEGEHTTAGAAATESSRTGSDAIEPHTGLPINTKLGTGAGGTDGNPSVEGYHDDPSVQQADWKGIAKANKPY